MANRIRKTMLTFYVTDEEKEFIKHKMSLMNIRNLIKSENNLQAFPEILTKLRNA